MTVSETRMGQARYTEFMTLSRPAPLPPMGERPGNDPGLVEKIFPLIN